MRLVTILAPAAVVVAAVAVVVSLDGGGRGDDADRGQGAAVEESAGEPEAGDESGGAGELEAPTAGAQLSEQPITSVVGPPGAVVAALRGEGLDARVVDGAVVVREAGAGAVRRALADRARGPVPVLLE